MIILFVAGDNHACNVQDLNVEANSFTACTSGGYAINCGTNRKSPKAPKYRTCGKLGSFNYDNIYKLPPMLKCGSKLAFYSSKL